VDGSTTTGPAPHISRVDFDGAMKNDVVMSPMPNVGAPPSTSGGWLRSGAISRTIMRNGNRRWNNLRAIGFYSPRLASWPAR
jgi:hypothetical protein